MRITRTFAIVSVLLVAAAVALGLQTEDGATQRPTGQPADITCQGNDQARTIFSEDFAAFDPDGWVVGGDASWDAGSGKFFATKALPEQAGRLFYGTRLEGCGFRAEFDYDMNGGSGADGLTLALVDYTDYDPAIGGGLDFCPGDDAGFAAEFDSFPNGGSDPAGEHVGVVQGCAGDQLASALMTVRGQHHAVVDFVEGDFRMYLDGNPVLSYTFDDLTYFDGFIGVTAATGGATDNHIVDNFSLEVINPLQGDLDCDGAVTPLDALIALLYAEDLPIEQELPCPPLDAVLLPGFAFADVNCDGAIDENDMMRILTFVADAPATPVDGCTPIGAPL